MSPAASLVTTDKRSNVLMCLLLSTKCFFLVLFHCYNLFRIIGANVDIMVCESETALFKCKLCVKLG